MTSENLPVPTGGDLPAWFSGEEPAYDLGGEDEIAQNPIAYIRVATPKTGSSGGDVTWASLQDGGCAAGDVYASGGMLDGFCRITGTPLLLIRCIRVAYRLTEEFAREGLRRIMDRGEASADESQAIDALMLVLDKEPFLASYSEQLHEQINLRSTTIGPWAAKLEKADEPAGLPRWARLVGRLRTEAKTAKSSGRGYYRESIAVKTLTTDEIDRLRSWVEGPMQTPIIIDALKGWAARYEPEPPADGPPPPSGDSDDVPF